MVRSNPYIQKATRYNDKRGVDTLVLDPAGLDDAISYVRYKNGKAHLVYKYFDLIAAFMRVEEMNAEDAMEWVEYNTIRSLPYMAGPKAAEPIVSVGP